MANRMHRGQFVKTTTPGFHKVFVDTIRGIPKEAVQLINFINGANPGGEAGRAFLEQFNVSSFGTFLPKAEGDIIIDDVMEEGSSIRATPYTFSLGYRCTRELKQDAKYGVFEQATSELAASAAHQIEVQGHRLYNNSFGTTGGTGHTATGFDNLALISTSHTRLKGGTRANRAAVDPGFSVTGIETLLDLLEGWVNHSGMPKPARPSTVVIPYQLRWKAREILNSELKPYTGNNEVNPLGGENLSFFSSHYITDSNAFWVQGAKKSHNLNAWLREAPSIQMDDDPNTGDTIVLGFFRMATWHGEPDGIVGSQGA